MLLIRFGYWRKDSEDYKKLLQEKLILARAEYVGSAAAGLVELAELESDTAANAKAGFEIVSMQIVLIYQSQCENV